MLVSLAILCAAIQPTLNGRLIVAEQDGAAEMPAISYTCSFPGRVWSKHVLSGAEPDGQISMRLGSDDGGRLLFTLLGAVYQTDGAKPTLDRSPLTTDGPYVNRLSPDGPLDGKHVFIADHCVTLADRQFRNARVVAADPEANQRPYDDFGWTGCAWLDARHVIASHQPRFAEANDPPKLFAIDIGAEATSGTTGHRAPKYRLLGLGSYPSVSPKTRGILFSLPDGVGLHLFAAEVNSLGKLTNKRKLSAGVSAYCMDPSGKFAAYLTGASRGAPAKVRIVRLSDSRRVEALSLPKGVEGSGEIAWLK